MENEGAARETFALGWLQMPGPARVMVGSVLLPDRPTTLGEARGGLRMVGSDEVTTRWLRTWAERGGGERSLLMCLPGGWYELRDTTIARAAGAAEEYVIRFDRRTAVEGPDA
jgi:hypothetical protein